MKGRWQKLTLCAKCKEVLSWDDAWGNLGVCPYCGHNKPEWDILPEIEFKIARWVVDKPAKSLWGFEYDKEEGHWEYREDV